jgi:predicted transcriptional regulator
MDKTTLYLDGDDYRKLKRIAASRKQAPAALVREAVAEYVTRHGAARMPRSVGASDSGLGDLGERAEDYLAGMGESPSPAPTRRRPRARR